MFEENSNNDEVPKKKQFYDEAGASRAVTSGIYILLSSLLGSVLLWVYVVIGTGSGGLEYYSLAGTISTIFCIFNSGFSSSYVAKIKDAMINEPEKVSPLIGLYSKILIIIGIVMTFLAFILALVIDDEYIRICLWMIVPQIFIAYFQGILSNLLMIKNRYDLLGIIGGLIGINVFIIGIFLMYIFKLDGYFHAIIPLISTLINLIPTVIFFKKSTPFKVKQLFKGEKLSSSKGKQESIEFLKYSFFSTITNLDGLGILANTVIFLTAAILGLILPQNERLKLMELLTIVMSYVIAKVIITFFSGPLNVEMAEAVAKGDIKSASDILNEVGRTCFLLGLLMMVILIFFSKTLVLILHSSLFELSGGLINLDLLKKTVILFIFATIGNFLYGFAHFFGLALVGSGYAKKSGLIFALTLIFCIILTPIFVYFYDIIGAGITMFLTGVFALSFMLRSIKKNLGIKYDFRILQQIPHLSFFAIIFLFYPLGDIFGLIPDLFVVIIISLIILSISIPFFGVFRPDELQMIDSIFNGPKLVNFGKLIINSAEKVYYLNPRHKNLKNKLN